MNPILKKIITNTTIYKNIITKTTYQDNLKDEDGKQVQKSTPISKDQDLPSIGKIG